jgi:poly(3-hydroxybutyrate) depolymerase
MAVNATNDQACPYSGGPGVASYVFLDSQQSIHLLAQAMGSEEEILNDQDGVEIFQNVFKYTYLNGDVIHYKFQGVGHNLGDLNASLPNLIISFLYN